MSALLWLGDHWLSVWLIGMAIIYLPGLKLISMAIIYLPGLKLISMAERNSQDEHFDGGEVLAMMFWTAVGCVFWPLAAVLACVAIACLPVFGIGYAVINSGGIRKKLTRAS